MWYFLNLNAVDFYLQFFDDKIECAAHKQYVFKHTNTYPKSATQPDELSSNNPKKIYWKKNYDPIFFSCHVTMSKKKNPKVSYQYIFKVPYFEARLKV